MKTYRIKFPEKVDEYQLDAIITDFYSHFSSNEIQYKYLFDLTNVEWLSNQTLLVSTGLFKTLIDSEVDFYVNFLEQGSFDNINKRKANQFAQLWEIWKIYIYNSPQK